jgi:hypothetical protein
LCFCDNQVNRGSNFHGEQPATLFGIHGYLDLAKGGQIMSKLFLESTQEGFKAIVEQDQESKGFTSFYPKEPTIDTLITEHLSSIFWMLRS